MTSVDGTDGIRVGVTSARMMDPLLPVDPGAVARALGFLAHRAAD